MIPASVQMLCDDAMAAAVTAASGTAAKAASQPRIRLQHRTCYAYDRPVWLSAHEIRLRPAPHARIPVEAYTLAITPAQHDLKWQQDAYGNWVARVLFSQSTALLSIEVDLVTALPELNPFDFLVADHAWQYPFAYAGAERHALMAYLDKEPAGARFTAWFERMRTRLLASPIDTIELLVAINRWIADDVRYLARDEPGIQSCEQTLAAASGSCRDSAWLLVQVLRHAGIAARFVSGYLLQRPVGGESPPGSIEVGGYGAALHAWCEAYLPGAGWIGLDATSGLLATEGHIPLACAALPESAAAVSGSTEIARSSLSVEMRATRLMPLLHVTGAR